METQPESDETGDEQFRSFGRFDPFEAKRLLSLFEDAGIRFQICPESIIVPSRVGTRRWRHNFVEIFIHEEDGQRARRIIRKKSRTAGA
jgi:hypothetical protein